MIISRTPFRVSFFGGGTDYPAWFREHGGAVLATTINKYCYITARHLPPFFEHKIRLVYSKIENCNTADEIAHPVIREVMRFTGTERGVEIHHDADLPARCGMGSSSSFTVGLLHALYALKGQMPSQRQLWREAIYIEQDLLKETVGSQDQVSAAQGGLNHISFLPNGEVSVRPVVVAPSRSRELNEHLMLFYTGIKRTASDVAKTYVEDIDKKKAQLRIMQNLVDEGLAILTSGRPLQAFGELLHEAWQLKRSLSAKTTNAEVDDIYARARAAGAVGGKLTGAGGGGFMLLFAPPDKRRAVKEALHELIYVPFCLESAGSQIIFFDPEEDYSKVEAHREKAPMRAFRELTELEGQ
ncbi:MAG: kinase [Planctomycetota bacterium]